MIEPNWTILFSTKRGPWWVRLLACGRYNHVKAIAYLPTLRAWLLYDVKFKGTRLMLLPQEDPDCRPYLRDYLDCCDMIAMPRLPVPNRMAPQTGFWCTLAMKHLVGIHAAALRPDRLWRESIAAGGEAFDASCGEGASGQGISSDLVDSPQSFDAVLAFLMNHAQRSSSISWSDEAAFARGRGHASQGLRGRLNRLLSLLGRLTASRRRPPCPSASEGA